MWSSGLLFILYFNLCACSGLVELLFVSRVCAGLFRPCGVLGVSLSSNLYSFIGRPGTCLVIAGKIRYHLYGL